MEAFHRFNVRTRLKRPIAVVLNASLIYVALGMQVQLDSTHGIDGRAESVGAGTFDGKYAHSDSYAGVEGGS